MGQWVGGWRKEGKHVTSLEIDGGGGRVTQHDDSRVCPATFALSRRRRKKEGAAVCCVLVLSLAPLRSSHCSCIPGTRVCLFLGCVCVFPGFFGLGKAWKGLESGMDSGNRIHYHGNSRIPGETQTRKRDMIIIQTCLYFSDPCKHRLSIPVGPLQLYVFSPFAASNGVVVGLDKSVYLPSAAAACKMCEWCNSRCNSRCWLRCPCPPPCPRPPGL